MNREPEMTVRYIDADEFERDPDKAVGRDSEALLSEKTYNLDISPRKLMRSIFDKLGITVRNMGTLFSSLIPIDITVVSYSEEKEKYVVKSYRNVFFDDMDDEFIIAPYFESFHYDSVIVYFDNIHVEYLEPEDERVAGRGTIAVYKVNEDTVKRFLGQKDRMGRPIDVSTWLNENEISFVDVTDFGF